MNVSVVTERRTPAYSSLAAGELNGLVARALLTEARLTPKPGLVDIRNSGAHRDMDLAAFERSTTAIAPWMEKFFIMGNNTAALAAENVLVMLRPLGMACENDMLQATNGVNTHRGAIFAFGLLSAAIGRLLARGEPLEQNRICDQVARLSRNIVAHELSVFNRVVQEHDDTHLALLQTLLHLMAWNDDTNLVSRGGLEGLYYVQQQAQKLLWQGGVLVEGGIEAMQSLDDELILRNLSPGGSADLLAVTWFLSHFPAGSLYPE
ncbi:triphosphoribosyl-dephospho-CoA synthase [Salmonella enterica subsp. enterica serovar Typhimurium]|nr:triphosphoribosyl-dephospho-CoA synthase [Salmonella enterica subsp. enterica serovar Typhimurium]